MVKKIEEAASLSDINFLVVNGLGKDQSKMSYYIRILQDPNVIRNNYAFVPYAAEILNNLTNFIFNDPVLYNRLRSDLVNKRQQSSAKMFKAGPWGPKAYESLQIKSEKSGIPISTLTEVYSRGYNDQNRPNHLTSEQHAFNRVNSFIAEGKAAQADHDLPRNSTLKTVKRIIKK